MASDAIHSVLTFQFFNKSENIWLAIWFVVYLLFVFIFSIIYYMLYRSDPNRFVFHGKILQTKRINLNNLTEKEIHILTCQTRILDKFLAELGTSKVKINKEPDQVEIILSCGEKLLFREIMTSISDITDYKSYLTIYNDQGLKIGPDVNIGMYIPNNKTGYQKEVNFLLDFLKRILSNKKKLAKSLRIGTLNVFCYRDFLYFSTITQSTVGYGDILPNCTIVRTIVMIQILIAYIILIVIINILL